MKAFFSKLIEKYDHRVLAALTAIAGAFLLFPHYFETSVYPIPRGMPYWHSLDPSWKLALSKAWEAGRHWGSEIVFTYGPLSFLSTRIGCGVQTWVFIVFDLFIAFNCLFIFYSLFSHTQNRIMTYFAGLTAIILLPSVADSGMSHILLAFLLFWIRRSFDNEKILPYVMQILLICLLFTIKFNTGLFCGFFFLLGLVYKYFFTNANRKMLWTYLLLLPVVLVSFCRMLQIDFWGYIKTGFEIVSGYNDIMYMFGPFKTEKNFGLLLMLLSLGILISIIREEKTQKKKYLFIFLLFFPACFILFKQAFTRMDYQHVTEFFRYLPIFLFVIPEFHSRERTQNRNLAMTVSLFTCFFFDRRLDDTVFNLDRRLDKSEYFTNIAGHSDTSAIKLFPHNSEIPDSLRKAIGHKSADIFPWNIQFLYENRINFVPRPIFQSYSAYTRVLENMNFAHYLSQRAPEYVFYQYVAVDNRYPLFDEPKVHLSLKYNYRLVDTFHVQGLLMALLERKKGTQNVDLVPVRKYEFQMRDSLPASDDIFYEIDVRYSIIGKMHSVIKNAPELRIRLQHENGQQNDYKIGAKLLQSGIFGARFMNSTYDFVRWMQDSTSAQLSKIRCFRLGAKHPSQFSSKAIVTEFIIKKQK